MRSRLHTPLCFDFLCVVLLETAGDGHLAHVSARLSVVANVRTVLQHQLHRPGAGACGQVSHQLVLSIVPNHCGHVRRESSLCTSTNIPFLATNAPHLSTLATYRPAAQPLPPVLSPNGAFPQAQVQMQMQMHAWGASSPSLTSCLTRSLCCVVLCAAVHPGKRRVVIPCAQWKVGHSVHRNFYHYVVAMQQRFEVRASRHCSLLVVWHVVSFPTHDLYWLCSWCAPGDVGVP